MHRQFLCKEFVYIVAFVRISYGVLRVRHFLTLKEYSREEIKDMILCALEFKRKRQSLKNISFTGKSIALIFEKPSTRTRASMVVAAYQLGILPVIYNWNELQLGRGEPIKDTARVLSRYHDILAARVYRHETLEELAVYSSVPVINMLSDLFHPLQALADFMTIYEKFGSFENVNVAFVGDGRDNVLNSLLIVATKLGVEIRVVSPINYWPTEEFLRELKNEKVFLTDDPIEAVKGANVIYTDVFVSMGQESEREERLKVFLPKYQVNEKVLRYAAPDYIFMHCLPAKRGQEVTDEVIEDKEHSVVWDQAENRLYTAKAVLSKLLSC